jgi:hypothetical protein
MISRTLAAWNRAPLKSLSPALAAAFLLCAGHAAASSGKALPIKPMPMPLSAVPLASVCTTGPKPYVALRSGAATSAYLMYGVQLRLDALLGAYTPGASWPAGYMGADGADYYFKEAASVGFKSVVVPVPWKYVEYTPTPGAGANYNFEFVDRVIASANAYGLKVQLIWFGSDVCGYSEAPDYIGSNPQDYPRLPSNADFLDLSNPKLVSAETNALVAMMNHVAAIDTSGCVVMLGIENEPDGAGPAAPSLVWGDRSNMAGRMYAGGQYAAVNSLINALATAVKNSAWTGVTRANIGSSYRSIDTVNNRAGLPAGVDIFGVDLYTSDLSATHNTLAQLAPPALFGSLSPAPTIDPLTSDTAGTLSKYTANVTHQPEGGGQYGNYISLALSNFADGGGALIYELRTLKWRDGGGVLQPSYDLGIFRSTANDTAANRGNWTVRDGTGSVPYSLDGTHPGTENSTAAITTFNTTIYKADQKIAVATPNTCAAFNLPAATPTGEYQQTLSVGGVPVTYQTWNNGQAFAMMDTNSDLIMLNLTPGDNFILDSSFHHGPTASVGYYDTSNVWHEQYTKAFSGDTLLCWGGECIRVARLP